MDDLALAADKINARLYILNCDEPLKWSGTGVDTGRELLIISDLLLVLVLGLLLYSWSARETTAPPGWFDRLQLVLVGAALLVDLLGLIAMVTRISTWGPSPNKFAALGLNLLLLVNLAWSARLMVAFLRERRPSRPSPAGRPATCPSSPAGRR